MKEPYRKGESDSILTLSLAGDAARCRSKRRQGHWWAGLLSFENDLIRDADPIPRGEGNTAGAPDGPAASRREGGGCNAFFPESDSGSTIETMTPDIIRKLTSELAQPIMTEPPV